MLETTTTTMRVLDIVAGEPPFVLLGKKTHFSGGKRPFTISVPVLDATLFQRFCTEVQRGDLIEATLVTEWTEDDYCSHLSDFKTVWLRFQR
jgi:hypothetical protein